MYQRPETWRNLCNIKYYIYVGNTFVSYTRKKAKTNCDNIEYHNAYKSLKINNEIYGLAEDGQKGGACECSIWKKNKIISLLIGDTKNILRFRRIIMWLFSMKMVRNLMII